MRNKPRRANLLRWIVVTSFVVIVAGSVPLWGAEPSDQELSAGASPSPICQVPDGQLTPDASPQPMQGGGRCGSCSTEPFQPKFGIVCTFANDCQPGANGCCEYTCGCGENLANTTIPANACTLDLPTNCCPGGKRVCFVSYCDAEGIRCVNNGCGINCCSYSCGPDPTCTAPDPLPPGVC